MPAGAGSAPTAAERPRPLTTRAQAHPPPNSICKPLDRANRRQGGGCVGRLGGGDSGWGSALSWPDRWSHERCGVRRVGRVYPPHPRYIAGRRSLTGRRGRGEAGSLLFPTPGERTTQWTSPLGVRDEEREEGMEAPPPLGEGVGRGTAQQMGSMAGRGGRGRGRGRGAQRREVRIKGSKGTPASEAGQQQQTRSGWVVRPRSVARKSDVRLGTWLRERSSWLLASSPIT